MMATYSNCGKPLRASTTTLLLKDCKGTQLTAGSNGKKVEDWAIRSHVPKSDMQGYGKGSTTKCLWTGGN